MNMTFLPAAVVRTLLVAVQQVRLYGGSHPASQQAIARFFRMVQSGLQQAPVQIEIDERTVLVQTIPQPTEDRYVSQLRTYLAARRIAGLVVQRHADATAAGTLVLLLAREPEELLAEGGLADALRAAGVSSIAVQVRAPVVDRPGVAGLDPYEAAVRTVYEITMATESRQPVDVPQALLTVEGLVAALGTEPHHLWRCIADRSHDELDPPHAVNTCLFTLFAAQAIGLPREDQVEVGVAALLHDVGLATLPWEHRLLERTIIGPRPQWRHPIDGAYLLRHIGGPESLPMIVAAEHHRPALGETPVLLHSTLVALADYLDAMTCGRVPAARQMSIGAAVQHLLDGAGPRFDSVQVRMLAELIRRQEAEEVEFSASV